MQPGAERIGGRAALPVHPRSGGGGPAGGWRGSRSGSGRGGAAWEEGAARGPRGSRAEQRLGRGREAAGVLAAARWPRESPPQRRWHDRWRRERRPGADADPMRNGSGARGHRAAGGSIRGSSGGRGGGRSRARRERCTARGSGGRTARPWARPGTAAPRTGHRVWRGRGGWGRGGPAGQAATGRSWTPAQRRRARRCARPAPVWAQGRLAAARRGSWGTCHDSTDTGRAPRR